MISKTAFFPADSLLDIEETAAFPLPITAWKKLSPQIPRSLTIAQSASYTSTAICPLEGKSSDICEIKDQLA